MSNAPRPALAKGWRFVVGCFHRLQCLFQRWDLSGLCKNLLNNWHWWNKNQQRLKATVVRTTAPMILWYFTMSPSGVFCWKLCTVLLFIAAQCLLPPWKSPSNMNTLVVQPILKLKTQIGPTHGWKPGEVKPMVENPTQSESFAYVFGKNVARKGKKESLMPDLNHPIYFQPEPDTLEHHSSVSRVVLVA